ncbi:Condensin complex subunit 3 [Psilocybe cubensis]|uniref:Condensin complex subunit 3 n=2 Tax=Psilocybe cubensis TaxID=181762 RepID=A0ACB8H864_PSICU|nr:Condensin complex subunit 3 [Psilocybe cubensis]KAH9484188.1 Condensin complex subunit 3 [Psilocybe cubensis]
MIYNSSSGHPTLLTAAQFSELAQRIAKIFEQIQHSKLKNDTKNYVKLYEIQKKYASHVLKTDDGYDRLIGEHRFFKIFQDMVQRFILLKKGVFAADCAVTFIGGYVKFINEKVPTPESSVVDDEEDDEQEIEELGGKTFEARFIKTLLDYLLRGFDAKDKNVRYRVLQVVTGMISHLGVIHEKLYTTLRAGFIARAMDKESHVRTQALISLIKLLKETYPEDISDLNGQPSIMDVLLDRLSYDPAADVRHTILHHVPINPQSLPAILERCRDTDINVRREVYMKLSNFEKIADAGVAADASNDLIDPHPENLTLAQREYVVKTGLGDRGATVRSAAKKLVWSWIDAIDAATNDKDVGIKKNPAKAWQTLLPAFLRLFDLCNGSKVAADALIGAFSERPVVIQKAEFSEQYWLTLTPQKTLFGRVFIEHCSNTNNDARLEVILPDVAAIALKIRSVYNMIVNNVVTADGNMDEDHKPDASEDDADSRNVIMLELLKLALHLDYSEDLGKRHTLQLMRDMISNNSLPENFIAPCFDILRILSSSERDFIRMVVETITDLRDAVCFDEVETIKLENVDDPSLEESSKSAANKITWENMTTEQKSRADNVDLRCLKMFSEMLKRVNTTFDKNSVLQGVVRDLIIPAMRREDSPIFMEEAWKSLGLCCLIAKDIAQWCFDEIVERIPTSSGDMKTILIQSLFDIVIVHRSGFFVTDNHKYTLESFTNLLHGKILQEEDPTVKALWYMGTAKLVIPGVITTVETMKVLLKAFLSPLTADNNELRQFSNYFFQRYSFACRPNQKKIADMFVEVFLDVSEDRKLFADLDEDMEAVASSSVANMFIELTDPFRVEAGSDIKGPNNANDDVQLDMAQDVIRLLYGQGLKINLQKEDKKVLCQLLNKLHIPHVVDDYKIRSLKILMDNLITRRPLKDSVCLNAFNKFQATISKKFEEQLEGFSEEDLRELEDLAEVFEFIDSMTPLDDDDDQHPFESRKKGKKRRSNSLTSVNESRPQSPDPSERRKPKRLRLSNVSVEEDSTIESTSKPRKTKVPKKPSTLIVAPEVIVISSDSDEEPVPPRTAKTFVPRPRTMMKEEPSQVEPALISSAGSLSLNEAPDDSVMDSEPGSEEEVNNLLADLE